MKNNLLIWRCSPVKASATRRFCLHWTDCFMSGNHSWHPFLLEKKKPSFGWWIYGYLAKSRFRPDEWQLHDLLWTVVPTESHTSYVGLMLTTFISQIWPPGHPWQSPTESPATPSDRWTSECLLTGLSGDQHGLKSCALPHWLVLLMK